LSLKHYVPIKNFSRFANRLLRFMEAYRRGLDGKDAAWVQKRYRGHRSIPKAILARLDAAGLGEQSDNNKGTDLISVELMVDP
jgi:hypothetical protein